MGTFKKKKHKLTGLQKYFFFLEYDVLLLKQFKRIIKYSLFLAKLLYIFFLQEFLIIPIEYHEFRIFLLYVRNVRLLFVYSSLMKIVIVQKFIINTICS